MNIYESIAAVMSDIGAVGKNSKNAQQGFMFRGIDAVMNALAPALIKNKVFIVPEILEQSREERTTFKGGTLIYSICKIKYTFYAEDGSNITAVVIGEGMDSGDKATNKAMSIAFKYACFQTFCIATEEMVDPDAECHEVKPRQQKKAAAKPEANPETTLITADKVEALRLRAKNDNIPEKLILDLYKISDLQKLTEVKFKNINDYWERIKELAKKDSEANANVEKKQ